MIVTFHCDVYFLSCLSTLDTLLTLLLRGQKTLRITKSSAYKNKVQNTLDIKHFINKAFNNQQNNTVTERTTLRHYLS